MQNLKIIEVKSEIGAGTRGASLGPNALRAAAWKSGSDWFARFPVVQVEDENHLLNFPTDTTNALRIEGIVTMYNRIADTLSSELETGNFPLILAADHASAGGTLAGLRKAYPKERIGAIWIDAHADLHSPYTSPSGNVHGMPLASALNEDNRQCQRNEVNTKTANLWDQLKMTAGIAPKINAEDLAFVAVRDTEKEEEALMERLNIVNHTVDQLRQRGASSIANALLDQLAECDRIYISFDVDSLDPSISLGTGTPVPNGLSELEATELLESLLKSEKITCLEVVEVNPCLDDKGNAMAETTFRILERVTRVVATNS